MAGLYKSSQREQYQTNNAELEMTPGPLMVVGPKKESNLGGRSKVDNAAPHPSWASQQLIPGAKFVPEPLCGNRAEESR